MTVYAVSYVQPDEEAWARLLPAHIEWLKERIADGSLLASGPFRDAPVKSALLIFRADNRAGLDAVIATDPFAIEGLISPLEVHAWDPVFGTYNALSSRPGHPGHVRSEAGADA